MVFVDERRPSERFALPGGTCVIPNFFVSTPYPNEQVITNRLGDALPAFPQIFCFLLAIEASILKRIHGIRTDDS